MDKFATNSWVNEHFFLSFVSLYKYMWRYPSLIWNQKSEIKIKKLQNQKIAKSKNCKIRKLQKQKLQRETFWLDSYILQAVGKINTFLAQF